MLRPTLYIVCGLPYSGKTTFSKEFAKKTGSDIVAYDWVWAREKPASQVPDLENQTEWNEISELAYRDIRQKLQKGKSVVFDHINHTKKDRLALAKLAEEANANWVILYTNTPQNVREQRRAEALENQSRHHVASVNMVRVTKVWEAPLGEDNVVNISPEQDINQLIGLIKIR